MIVVAWLAVTLTLLFALRPDLYRRLIHQIRNIRPWHVGSVLWAAAVAVAVLLDVMVAVLAAVVVFIGLWMYEISLLMRAGDDAFPGKSDKVLWLALLLVAPPVGLLLFRSYREAHWAAEKPVVGAAARDFS